MKLPVIVTQVSDPFSGKTHRAYCPFFPDCRFYGRSEREAVESLKEYFRSSSFMADVTVREVEIE